MAARTKIVYSLRELKSFNEKKLIGESPLETSSYNVKLNRIAASKQNGNVNASCKVTPPHQNLNASPHSQPIGSKQQSMNDSRLLIKNENEFRKIAGNMKSLNHKGRGTFGDERLESELNSGFGGGNGGGGGTSAEQQRLQFEREREQILLDRQKSKKTPSGKVNDFITSESSNNSIAHERRATNNGSYHNDCDLLMDELANNVEGSHVTGSFDTDNKSGNDKGYSLLSPPPGTKKISLNSIFASSSSSSQPANPPEPIIPVANVHIQANKGDNNGIFSQAFGTKIPVYQPPRHEEEAHIGDISIDEDFEASMRLIERMVFDDKEDDRNDNNCYDTQIQPSPQYSFFDGMPLSSTNMSELEQHVPSTASNSPAVSVSVNSLFKAAILKSEGDK
jgi:hypothetical protein